MRKESYIGEPEAVSKFIYHAIKRAVVSNDQTSIATIKRECIGYNVLDIYNAMVNKILDTLTEQREEFRRSVTTNTVTFLSRSLDSERSKLTC